MAAGIRRKTKQWLWRKADAVRAVQVGRSLRRAGSVLHVEFDNRYIGFFAQMNVCLVVLDYADRTGRQPLLQFTSENYLDPAHGPCWLHYFFVDRKPPAEQMPRPIRVTNGAQLAGIGSEIDLLAARELLFRYFDLKEQIKASLAEVISQKRIGPHTLGIHYRGTDKSSEATPVAYETVGVKLRGFLEARPDLTNVFVASDDARFIRFVRSALPFVPICTLEDSVRSENERPIHQQRKASGNFEIGRDAIMNALVLSRCGQLVRTTSFLSGWASVFNPDLPVALLNQPRPGKLWFPETQVIPNAALL